MRPTPWVTKEKEVIKIAIIKFHFHKGKSMFIITNTPNEYPKILVVGLLVDLAMKV